MLLAAAACVRELAEPTPGPGPREITLTVDGSIQPFDAESGTKAAAALSWKGGDILYVRSETEFGANTSYAEYNGDGTWTFHYTGSFQTATKVQCCFIEKPRSASAFEVQLSYSSVIYEDAAATLTVEEDAATLNTYLKPKTGRISFHGGPKTIKVTGLSWYNTFDLANFEFTETVNANVNSFATGESNYFYGFFGEDNTARELFVTNDKLIFKRSFGEQVLRPGVSGYVDVPANDTYEGLGWTLTNEDELVRYQPIQFGDENFKAWLLAQGYDRDGDGEISIAEGEKVTQIVNEGNNTVASLTGIEYFPNLRTLRWEGISYWGNDGLVTEGQLTSVDLSQNAKLTEINLNCNQLTALDLSGNPLVRELRVYGNKISDLDLNGGAALEVLECSHNLLTSLDISGYPQLRHLSCNENQLTLIDLSYCPLLTWIQIENNQISSINISSLPDLTHLYCGSNQLSSLDISSCHNLQELYCAYNQLSSLDVTSCPDLHGLHFYYNQDITSIDLHNCPNLTSLEFSGTKITDIDLSNCPNLNSLYCWSCQLNALDLSSLTNLTILYCNNAGLTSLDLSHCTKLEILDCADNDLKDNLDISNCMELRDLDCANTGLTELDLTRCPKLEWLYCSNNDFSASGLNVSANSKLRSVNCSFCHLPALEVSFNSKLEYLYCHGNEMTELNVYANDILLYLYASSNPQLEYIYVRTGHVFYDFSYDDTTEIVYQD